LPRYSLGWPSRQAWIPRTIQVYVRPFYESSAVRVNANFPDIVL
jgi:hypothetical protein